MGGGRGRGDGQRQAGRAQRGVKGWREAGGGGATGLPRDCGRRRRPLPSSLAAGTHLPLRAQPRARCRRRTRRSPRGKGRGGASGGRRHGAPWGPRRRLLTPARRHGNRGRAEAQPLISVLIYTRYRQSTAAHYVLGEVHQHRLCPGPVRHGAARRLTSERAGGCRHHTHRGGAGDMRESSTSEPEPQKAQTSFFVSR